MARVEDVPGFRVVVTWDGRRIDVKANCPLHVQLVMLDTGHAIVLNKFASGGPGAQEIARQLRGEA